jgi:pimeloyl-ACP methyl ester carboxylesterase
MTDTPDNLPISLEADIGGVDLPYLLYDGPGAPLILLHATGFLPWLWHPIARKLAKTNLVIAPYFCDHRDSDLEKGGLRWMQLADDINQLCTLLRIENPIFVGHSMGASVLTLAEALHGPLAKGLLLIEPIFLPEDYYRLEATVDNHPLARKSIRRRNLWNDPREARAYLKSKALFSKWDNEMLDLYIRHGMQSAPSGDLELTCRPEKEAALFVGGLHNDPWPVLSKVQCPVLILEGEESGNRAWIDLEMAAQRFPHAEHRLIPGTGHLIPMEKPGKITEIVRSFADQVTR